MSNHQTTDPRPSAAPADAPEWHPSPIPVWRPLLALARRLRRFFSRREWSIRLLRLWTSPVSGDEPGLVMIQIDGLSRRQFERALQEGRMPFLQSLLRRESYDLHTLYSGIPSTTPAVQAELFYGVKTAVPAFSFREAETGRIIRMVDLDAALRREKQLAQRGEPLLAGGSAYSEIYSGGADEAHFCPAAMGWGNMLENATLPRSLLVLLWNVTSLFRTAVLFGVEVVLAVVDAIRGPLEGRSIRQEWKFVPSRVAICVLLRELIAIGAEIDATRGLPIIHLNLLGYDEQAHRRGPDSAFAHWSLGQIDKSIRRISDSAFRSRRRDYQVWIYSDHGQQPTRPYPVLAGKTLQDVALDIHGHTADAARLPSKGWGVETFRAAWLGGGPLQKLLPKLGMENLLFEAGAPVVADKGPIGHIYWPGDLSSEERDRIVGELLQNHVPLVFAVDDDGSVIAWNGRGRFQLPRDAAKIFGDDHPFLEELTRDWIQLCRHPEAGTFIASGWSREGDSVSFVVENGAHAGPGPEETRAFALLPREARLSEDKSDYLRPLHLRNAALHALQPNRAEQPSAERKPQPPPETIRIMTYNVHSCIGLDGKLSPRRIARLIAQSRADIVCLQELDVGRLRTGGEDQAQAIARELAMEFHFHPALDLEEEKYGDAILSRFPLRQIRAGALPHPHPASGREPRGALWVSVDIHGRELQVINTHLGLSGKERLHQARALLGADWLAHPDCADPVILCGDFNAGPSSRVYREITRRLHDAQRQIPDRRPRNTWTSAYPLRRIDHLFYRGGLSVISAEVPRTRLARTASDHLPMIVEVRLDEGRIR